MRSEELELLVLHVLDHSAAKAWTPAHLASPSPGSHAVRRGLECTRPVAGLSVSAARVAQPEHVAHQIIEAPAVELPLRERWHAAESLPHLELDGCRRGGLVVERRSQP